MRGLLSASEQTIFSEPATCSKRVNVSISLSTVLKCVSLVKGLTLLRACVEISICLLVRGDWQPLEFEPNIPGFSYQCFHSYFRAYVYVAVPV